MPTQSIAGLLDSLMAEVNVLATRLNRGHDQNLLPSGARSVLQVLGRGGSRTVPQIARERQTSRQNIQTLVNRLKKTGSVQLSANAAHKRSVLVHLTEKGKTLLHQIQESESGFEDQVLTRIPAEQIESTTKILRNVRRLLEEQIHLVSQRETPKQEPVAKSSILHRPRAVRKAEVDQVGDDAFPFNLL